MKKYLSYFKLRFNVALQYRTSAIAGMFTQFFWAIMQILIYSAFYKVVTSKNISLEQLVSYIWLRQAFYAIINHSTDSEIRKSIETGSISYELCRPINIYWMWISKTIAGRLAGGTLKCLPILIVAPFLPKAISLKMPYSIGNLMVFLIMLGIGLIIIAELINLFYISIFYTLTSKGTTSIFYATLEFFGGGFIPIALMPSMWQKICYLLPISVATDVPFRIYSGNLLIQDSVYYIGLQLIWIVALALLGNLILKNRMKKLVIQGG